MVFNMKYSFVLLLLVAFVKIGLAEYRCDTTHVGTAIIVKCSTFTDAGKLVEAFSYKNGELDGEQTTWHKNGVIDQKSTFKNGKIVDTSYFYYESGMLKTLSVMTGLSFKLSENGDTLGKGYSKDGRNIGTQYAWYENKNRKYITNYNDFGKKHSLEETWHEDGTRKDSVVYDNGIIVEGRYYYKTGKLRYYVKRTTDYKKQEAVYYSPTGKVSGEVKNGFGTYIVYDEDGKEPLERKVEDGKIVSDEWVKEQKK
jgi:antitoxin component YwqK of YwqJK toxin-antitoxin module